MTDSMIEQREQKYQNQVAFENWKQEHLKPPPSNASKFSMIQKQVMGKQKMKEE